MKGRNHDCFRQRNNSTTKRINNGSLEIYKMYDRMYVPSDLPPHTPWGLKICQNGTVATSDKF